MIHQCSRDLNQGRGPACPLHPYGFAMHNHGARIDTKLDESAPEGAYRPEPVYSEPWALKAASRAALGVAVVLALVPLMLHFAARMGWLS